MADRRVRLILEAQVSAFNSRLAQARQSAEGFGGSLRQAVRQPEVQAMGRTLTAFGAAATAALGVAAKSAMDWETSWTDVMRRTDGTPQQLSALEDGLRGIAREMPATHQEIAEVAASAAQLGVGVNDVEDFTRTMIQMGATTNMSADQAATAMARFANVMGTSHDDFDRLGSAIVDLGNNSATTESEIMDMAQRIAGAGNAMGMSEGEVLGFAAALSSVGVQAAAGGTAISRTMYDIDAAVAQGGDSLEGFAEIAGMSADEFSRLWAEDAASGMEAFISGLGRIQEEGGSVAQALEAVGITEVRTVAAMTQMASAGDMLGESLERGNRAFEENGAMAAEYAYIQETVAAQIQVFRNRVNDAAIELGQALLPAIEGAVNALGDLVTRFSELPGWVQSGAVQVAALTGGLALLAGSFLLLAPGAFQTYDALKALGVVGPKVTTAVRGLARALPAAAAGIATIGALDWVWNQFATAPPDIRETQLAMENLAETGEYTGNIENFALAIDEVDSAGGRLRDSLPGWAAALMTGMGSGGAAGVAIANSKNLSAELEQNDKVLAQMMESGNLDGVAAGVSRMAADFLEAGKPLSDLTGRLPELDLALRESGISMDELLVALGLMPPVMEMVDGELVTTNASLSELRERLSDSEQEALAAALGVDDLDDSLNGMAEEALTAAEALREVVDSMVEAGMITRDVRGAARDYEAALDNLTASIEQNGATLDTTTEAGRQNEAALDGIADAGIRSAQAMADNGASQQELQASLMGTYNDLVTAAQQFGLTGEQAAALAAEILGVPGHVDIGSDMDENAARVAEWLNSELDKADGRSTFSEHLHTIRERRVTVGSGAGSRLGSMVADRFATGGSVSGPGTGTSDDIPAWLSNGEHVLTAREVALMGGQSAVYDFRAGLTGSTPQRPSGRQMMPSYQSGGAVQARQIADAMQSTGGDTNSAGPSEMTGTLYLENGAMLGQVRMAMADRRVIRTVSQGLADLSDRDRRGANYYGRRR